jgi:D-cysteine desulfhydrase
LSEALGGPRILIKRDDLTGLAAGGNKTRKLEYLIGDALAQGADCVITTGAAQSNHCRQTAAAAAHCGIGCHLVLGGEPPPRPAGNYFLDQLLGAEIHWIPKPDRVARMDSLATELRASGASPYVIPIGGSNPIGALGYVAAMFELGEQLAAAELRIDHIVFGSSSGGTQAGMALGAMLSGYDGVLTGISIDHTPDEGFQQEVCDIANGCAELLGVAERIAPGDLGLNCDYLGGGYGVVGDLEREAVRLLARTEGMLVGPVYTGRALGAAIDLVRQGAFKEDEMVLFWHTGDDAALHAYVDEFVG